MLYQGLILIGLSKWWMMNDDIVIDLILKDQRRKKKVLNKDVYKVYLLLRVICMN